MKNWCITAALTALVAVPAAASGEDLRLSISNGRVTIVAQDVPLKQILDEWGRVGQTKVLGAERLTGPAVTLELHDVAEGRALETLLRSASGYIVRPRVGTVGASTFDSILIMPPSRPPAVTAAPPQQFNTRPQPQVVMPNVTIDDDEPNPVLPPGAAMPPAGQQFPGQPPMQPGTVPGMQPGQQQPPTTLPRPGMLPPPVPGPGTPGNPYQPNPVVIRPPGVPGPGGPGGPGGS
jgi:hypothetical protein